MKMRVIEEVTYKRPFRVVDEHGDIAIGMYGYRGRVVPVRYKTREAAERAIVREEEARAESLALHIEEGGKL